MPVGYSYRQAISPGGETLLAGPLARKVLSAAFYCVAGAEPPMDRPRVGGSERTALLRLLGLLKSVQLQ